MTLRTGKSRKGFTLVEVMVTVAVLSFGLAMIYRAFFSSLDALMFISQRFLVNLEINNRLWEAEDSFNRAFDEAAALSDSGKTIINNVPFGWKTSGTLIDGTTNLHKVEVDITWPEKNRKIVSKRFAYVGK
jgi:prepilin-type N-terminal cleavage/methylation domain-containing protein